MTKIPFVFSFWKHFKKINFFLYFKLIILVFLDYFDMLMSKIIFKK